MSDRNYYEWEIEKYLLFGKGWRVWFLVFPNDTVIIRWVSSKRIDADKNIEDKVKKETARLIWRMLVVSGGYRRVK